MVDNAQAEREIFARNFRRLLRERGRTQADVVEALGITASTVSDWANAKKYPRVDKLQRLAGYFGVELWELRESPDGPRGPGGARTSGGVRSPGGTRTSGVRSDMVRIPVVGTVVAGIPTEAVEYVVDWEEIPLDTAHRGDYIGLKVKGASMEPRFLDGDTVIVRRQPDVESGEIAIVFVNGNEATMKRVHKTSEGITLIALNPTVYEPHFYSNRQIAELPVAIYGKVVELRGKL